MGHPKKQRKKYSTPKRPWDRNRIEKEKKILMEFGLRRKHEIWRAEEILRTFRSRARDLQAKRNQEKEKMLFDKIKSMGIKASKLDDVLTIRLDDLLGRRLQTIVYKKGLSNTPMHARQMIVHGHISVEDRKVFWPSYIVQHGEEDKISLSPTMGKKIIEVQKKN